MHKQLEILDCKDRVIFQSRFLSGGKETAEKFGTENSSREDSAPSGHYINTLPSGLNGRARQWRQRQARVLPRFNGFSIEVPHRDLLRGIKGKGILLESNIEYRKISSAMRNRLTIIDRWIVFD